jgi:Glycosyltransferase family 87
MQLLAIFNCKLLRKRVGVSSSNVRGWTAATVCVWVMLTLGLAIFSYRYPWSHTVYDIYARACQQWWSGQDMYCGPGTAFYRYSPLFAISMTPWALLPNSWGGALWRIFSSLFYAAALRAWAERALPERCSRSQRAALFLLVLPLSVQSMYNGQANIIMLSALLFGLAAASANDWNKAAGWFAFATLIKGYPLALVLLIAGLGPRRFLFRYASALVLGLLLPFATQRPHIVIGQYASWLAHLRESTVIMRERLRTLEHLLSICGCPVSPRAFQLIQLLAGLVILGLCLIHARRTPEPRRRLLGAFALFSSWVVLFGPATETCTYVVVAPVIAWELIDAFARPTAWGGRLLLIVSLLMMGPLVTDFVGPAMRDFANGHGSQPIGALLLFSYLLMQMTGSHRVCYAEGSEHRDMPRHAAA